MRTPDRNGEGRKYALTADEDEADFWGFAHDAEGLFTPLPGEDEGARRVRFTGCDPRGGLLKSTGRVGSRRAAAGNAWLGVLGADGASMGSYFVNYVTVTDVRPSPRGGGLVDLTVTLWCDQLLPGAAEVWDLIRAGRLQRTGLWHGLDPEARRAWLSVALCSREYRRRGRPDAPAGRVFTLDGRHVVDADSFYCAIGEAVNGPCGYFGWNLDALVDCLRGRWGATAPFTLEWQDSAEARSRLEEIRPGPDDEETLFDVILEIFEEQGVRVVLR
ncbi:MULTISPECIES: barstar family protein [Streptomyces]|uniref:Barstar domain containing protein n=2 Tax=Streptomyces TaxID=1883 RepID=A0A3S5IL75_9ACTN|nr:MULTISPECIES: barstar family protein [Streptomyces]KNE84378.1 Barstar domain containing protein [Streptomyces fradiae]OFA58956.1 Barstar domain containing protein [Streptomyces fradiae]PQM22277.1 Barstar domain containing protein [Streptomyces xinghaiensis]RKM95530.1 Barstar domain containing protein [Streptomyces xinghaiensis]RNC73116.1 Barstar domain containing protein [Streptomyces xinghaiensis]